jgi:hypothetical protein
MAFLQSIIANGRAKMTIINGNGIAGRYGETRRGMKIKA